jgi:hypothetical protein
MPWHLAMNMMALYSLGRITEQLWGHARYLAIYVVGALGSTCLALISRLNPPIGASGAVCAIFASWAVWFFYNRQHLPPPLFFAWQRNFLVNVVLLTFISLFPGVSWEGHLGGAIAGFALALWFSFFQIQFGWRRWLNLVGVILIAALSVGFLIRAINSDSQWQRIREHVEWEEMQAYFPGMRSAESKALKTYSNDVKSLLEMRASRRDADDVGKTIGQLEEELQELQDNSDILRKKRPFRTPFVERVRQVRLQITNEQITLLRLSTECLKKGEQCTEKDEERLKQQEEVLQKVTEEGVEILKSHRRR